MGTTTYNLKSRIKKGSYVRCVVLKQYNVISLGKEINSELVTKMRQEVFVSVSQSSLAWKWPHWFYFFLMVDEKKG